MGSTAADSSASVVLVTGGASGIGLSIVEHLHNKGWKVAIIDLNETSGHEIADRLGENVLFLKVDVSDYEQLADAFAKTWDKWHKLDFVFANAGIGDRINFYTPAEPRASGTPSRPDTAVIDICLLGVVYCAYLALHFFRQNANKSGKLVSTSSMAGLYPAGGIPLYAAAKHGVVGLTRSLAQQLAKQAEPITVNCLCPGLLDTGLTHSSLIQVAPGERVTPHTTIIRAIESFLEDDSKNGLAAECSEENIYYRTQPEWGDEGAEWVMTTPFEKLLAQNATSG